jgi:dTDP-4-dehydrorhamnose 3,5-epimerase
MNIIETPLSGVLILEPAVFADDRGYFLETYNVERYRAAGLDASFVQDNLSFSRRGTLRGLHFQNPQPQGKLVHAVHGGIFDVAVDLRPDSSNFGRWTSVVLSDSNKRQCYIPPGFAHGFCVISDTALVAYKCTELYNPQADASLLWNDPDIGIDWPVTNPIISAKDAAAPRLRDIPRSKLTWA